MALTSAQKNKIMEYLGYPLKVLSEGSEFYSTIIVSRVENLDIDSENIIIDLLAKIEDAYTKMFESQSRMLAVGVGDIKLNSDEFIMLKKAKNFWIDKLSNAIGLTKFVDYA